MFDNLKETKKRREELEWILVEKYTNKCEIHTKANFNNG